MSATESADHDSAHDTERHPHDPNHTARLLREFGGVLEEQIGEEQAETKAVQDP